MGWPAPQGAFWRSFRWRCDASAGSTNLPLKKSANGRYLVDQNNTPFLIIGDTAWSLNSDISEADAAVYFAKRQIAGFTTSS